MMIKVTFAVTEVGADASAGDYFTALELGQALQDRFGWKTDYRSKGDNWYDLSDADILIVMVDEYELPSIVNSKSKLVAIAWARNWFERWSKQPWIGDYDLLLASSELAVEFLSKRVRKRARLFRIATNPQRFALGRREKPHSLDFVFTGSYWHSQRDIVDALSSLPRKYRGAIYGKHWEAVPAVAHLDRGFVPYSEIHGIYQQALIVIDDANHVTKAWGAANSRVFDALASGCLVITNSRSVSDEVFDGLLPVYETPMDLDRLLDSYLTNQGARDALQRQLQRIVLERHGYKHRAIELGIHLHSMGKINPIAFDRRVTCDTSTSSTADDTQEDEHTFFDVDETKPLVSFVIPVFNNLAATQKMLSSLQASLPKGLSHEIIMSDDASTDGVAAWLQSIEHPNIRVLMSETNRGYAGNNNAAVALARGKVLGLLNSDVAFEAGWIEPMMAILDSATLNAGLVGNLQYRVADNSLDHAGVELTPNAQLHHIATAPPKGVKHVKTFAVTGACMLLHKADFDAVGGFDESFVNGCEDIDLCFKLRAKGKGIYLAAESHIHHHVSLSRQRNTLQDLRNSRLLFSRWRKELKLELSNRWYPLLQAGPEAYSVYGVGQLTQAFTQSPRMATSLVAESMLKREEREWSARLNQTNSDVVDPVNCRWQGLLRSSEHQSYVLEGELEVLIEGVSHILDFYVCGHRLGDLSKDTKLRFDVNGIQQFIMPLGEGRNVNVGIKNPIVLGGVRNVFKVRSDIRILVSHFVIDGRVVNLGRGGVTL